MEKTPHVLFAAEGAKKFAVENGIEPLPEGSLVTKRAQEALTRFNCSKAGLTEIPPVTEVRTISHKYFTICCCIFLNYT